jgi:hypothetical protein
MAFSEVSRDNVGEQTHPAEHAIRRTSEINVTRACPVMLDVLLS